MPGQRRLSSSFEFLDYIIRHLVNEVGDIVEIEWKELEHLADNDSEDRVLFSTTTGVIFHLHVCNLYCCTNLRLESLSGDCHRGGGYVCALTTPLVKLYIRQAASSGVKRSNALASSIGLSSARCPVATKGRSIPFSLSLLGHGVRVVGRFLERSILRTSRAGAGQEVRARECAESLHDSACD
jgi:hypothetical protein